MRQTLPAVMAFCAVALSAGCAANHVMIGREQIDDEIRSRTGKGIQVDAGRTPVPSGVSIDDGLSADEAVAIALWNSPAFEATLADLGIARADLIDARLLKNPVLSLLFPVGPKQLEWTLQFAVDAVWQRPRRMAAASLNLQVVGQRLVSDGLMLVASVRQAYADASAAERRVALAAENVELSTRIAGIAEARLRAGDISELEARAPRTDAAQARLALRSLEHDRASTERHHDQDDAHRECEPAMEEEEGALHGCLGRRTENGRCERSPFFPTVATFPALPCGGETARPVPPK